MYKSPVELITKEMNTQIEEHVFNAIQEIAVNINKEELIRALKYDRDQYEQGYIDGKRANEWIKINSDFDLPLSRGDYIVYTGNDYDPEVIAIYYCGDDNWDDGTGIAKGSWYGISHWMSLPEPPKN